MLQRQRTENGEEEEEDGDEGEEESLADRMAGLDLDKDSDTVWERLTPSERADFERQAASGALARLVPIWRPWWLQDNTYTPPAVVACLSKCPPLAQLLGRQAPHGSVHFDVLQALLTSAAVARRLNGEHLDTAAATEAAAMITDLCPALEPVHQLTSETDAVAEFATKLCSSPLLLLLLRDLLTFLQPCSGFQASQRALAELSIVLRSGAKAARKRTDEEAEAEVKRLFLASKKAVFWLSWAMTYFGELRNSVPTLETELCKRTAEGREQRTVLNAVEQSGVRKKKKEQKTLIQELD